MTNEQIAKDLSDSEVLFLTIVGEARGEPIEGQIAVGNVIMNRVKKSHKTVKRICLEPKQFSCWNMDDKNRPMLENIVTQMMQGNYDFGMYKQIQWVVDGLITGKLRDNSKGNLNYMRTDLFQSDDRPTWANIPKTDPFSIGAHTFFTA